MSKKRKIILEEDGTLKLECTKCKNILPSKNFWKWSRWPDWFKYMCKDCRKNEYNSNKEKILLNRREYYNKNREQKIEYQKRYYYNNMENIKLQHRVYREKNKTVLIDKRKENYAINKEAIKEKNANYSIKKSEELWFNWRKFHDKTSGYINRHKLSPNKCPICGNDGRIVAHHPSYESFESWKNVVFVCDSCHQDIHIWNIDCPPPINLVELKIKWQDKNKNSNDEDGKV